MSITYPELGLPQAWRPLFKALDAIGWQLKEQLPQAAAERPILVLEHESQLPILLELRFWEEPEWCGNNFQGRALTVAHFRFLPSDSPMPDAQLPLTGEWQLELPQLQKELEMGLAKAWKSALRPKAENPSGS